MPEPSGRLWLRQVSSDHACAQRVLDRSDPGTFCHAVAKYQQVVEKSVKAIAAELQSRGVLSINVGFRHDVDRLLSALRRLPVRYERKGLQGQINGLFNEYVRGEVRALSALAPKKPGPEERFRRNTEYPFQSDETTWQAPADEGVFDFQRDVERFRSTAYRVWVGCSRIISSMERGLI